MKKLMIILLMLLSFSMTAAELQEKTYYNRGEVEVTADCPAYPVMQMIQAFLDKDIAKAKTFGTTEYDKFVENRTQGWDHYAKTYHTNWDQKQVIRFKFYPDKKKAGDIIVKVLVPEPKNLIYSTKYSVQKIDGQYKLVPKD